MGTWSDSFVNQYVEKEPRELVNKRIRVRLEF